MVEIRAMTNSEKSAALATKFEGHEATIGCNCSDHAKGGSKIE